MQGGVGMTKKRKKIKKDMLEQLKNQGVTGEHYKDLINDYMSLWDIKNELIKDIEEKGVSIKYQNGKNQFGYKKNDSIPELNKVSAQMLKILSELGLKPSPAEEDDNDFIL